MQHMLIALCRKCNLFFFFFSINAFRAIDCSFSVILQIGYTVVTKCCEKRYLK